MRLHLKNNEAGAVLITILVMLVIISLGAGVAVMLNSSSIQSVENNLALRATNLSEAGFRYAGAEYANAGSGETRYETKLLRLEGMNQEEVTLKDDNGSFKLAVYPYFFLSSSDGETTSLNLRVPGKFPKEFQDALNNTGTGKVYVNEKFPDYTNGSAVDSGSAGSSDTFTITLSETVSIELNDTVFLSLTPRITPGAVPMGSDLTILSASDARLGPLLPDRNGFITEYEGTTTGSGPSATISYAKAGTYRYKKRYTDPNGQIALTDLQNYKDGGTSIHLDGDDIIVIPTQVDITSTGTVGSGGMASSRDLSLNVFLTEDNSGIGSTATDLDLNGSAEGTAETFSSGNALGNWDVPNASDIGQYITTSVNVSTIFGDNQGNSTDNFLTFQNFTTVDEDSDVWYMTAVDKIHLASIGKGDPDQDGYYSSYHNLYGVWGNDDDNMYIVGANGTILHYDGTDFNLETVSPTQVTKTLRAVWGVPSSADVAKAKENNQKVPADRVFVAGNGGTTLIDESDDCAQGPACWKPASITKITGKKIQTALKKTADLYAAYGTSWGHFDAYGDKGANPYNWDSENTADKLNLYTSYKTKYNFRCLWAIDYKYGKYDTQNIIVGKLDNSDGFIYHEFFGYHETRDPLGGIWGSKWNNSSSNIYAVGDGGKVYHNTRGKGGDKGSWRKGWTDITQTVWGNHTKKNLNGVYGNTATDFYIVGDDGTLLYFDGNFHKARNREGIDAITADLNSIWGSEETGIWAVGDNGTIVYLGRPANTIEGYILPFNLNAPSGNTGYTYYNMENGVNNEWKNNSELLSYSIQIKQVWAEALNYAAAGVNFRWNNNSGYGVSFMRFNSITSITDDGIPNGIKPANDLNDALLLVLWKKEGTTYSWLAYKNISHDDYVTKTKILENGTEVIKGPMDLSSLIVRVEEKVIHGKQVNDISVYYGNASESDTAQKGKNGSDNIYNNTKRNRYNPTFLTQTTNDITWPAELKDWTACDGDNCNNGSNRDEQCCNIDIFTLVDGWTINGAQSVTLTGDEYATDYILRTSDFTTTASNGNLNSSHEWAIHTFGDVGSNENSATLSVTDFAVQLGINLDGGKDTPSTFSDIR